MELRTTDLLVLVILGLILVAIPVSLVLRGQPPADVDVMSRHRSFLIGLWIRNWWVALISPIERFLVRMHVTPDAVNATAFVVAVGAGAAFASGMSSLGGLAVALSGTADILDGRIARARQMSSVRGAFMDATLDRVAEVAFYSGLAIWLAGSKWAVLIIVLALSGSLMVSYTHARGLAHGVESWRGPMQRGERLACLSLAAVLDAPAAAFLGWHSGAVVLGGSAAVALGAWLTALGQAASVAAALKSETNQNAE